MSTQPVSFSAPASRAWRRTTRILFRPFDFKKWLVLGFTAWLAGLESCGGGGGGSNARVSDGGSAEDLGQSAAEAWQNLAANSFWLGLAAFGCLVLLVVVVAVLWVSSRGKFMFLDNVVHERALVVDPWNRFRRQGNSLFGFMIAAGLTVGLIVVGSLLAIAATVGFAVFDELRSTSSIALPVLAAATYALLLLAVVYVYFFLGAFVVPLMHRYGLGVMDGWRRFCALLRQRAWPFLLCGLLVLIAGIGVLVTIFAFGLMTCCLGFLLLIVPYVGSVILLPVTVFYRSFTLEFLAQFDPDLLTLPQAAPAEPAAGE
jgi:hypothetical protein